jgi:transposase
MYNSKQLDHLGLVSGMIDELGLVSQIDSLLSVQNKERDLGIGTICKALIINGLGFTQRTLYMVSSFFEDKPIGLLLGDGITSDQLNDTTLGRALDDIHQYGCTELYAGLVPQICKVLGLEGGAVHMDTTDFHVDGVYNSRKAVKTAEQEDGEEQSVIQLRQGYSRDHRPDLNQVVLNLIVENQAGIPLHMAGLDGNTSDKAAFQATIDEHIRQLQRVTKLSHLVMDSAGYTEKSLTACGDTLHWVSRVPETLTASKTALAKHYDNWEKLSEGYTYVALEQTVYDIQQRWLLVFSQAAYDREMITLRKDFAKKSTAELNAFNKLCHEAHDSESAAQKAFDGFLKKCKYLSINQLPFKSKAVYTKKGRPSSTDIPSSFQYFIQGAAYTERAIFEKKAHTKGKFIIATNDLDKQNFSDLACFETYKGQSKVERGFRFLKDPQFLASTIFVKKPERVEALLFIMTTCLTVYAAIEYRIRQALAQKDLTFPNQLGKKVKNPTARWVFQCFSNITVLFNDSCEKTVILNMKPNNLFIINLLGDYYYKYYSST